MTGAEIFRRSTESPASTAPAHKQPRGAARGFTLIELLVVIAIIGILIALLLPAVQAAREAARRSQCGNNLKQVGLALQLYHGAARSYPTGLSTIDINGNPSELAGSQITWLNFLLPFIEEQNVVDEMGSYSAVVPGYYVANRLAWRLRIATYCCPSDDVTIDGHYDQAYNGGPGFTRSNVVGCFSADGTYLEPNAPGSDGCNNSNPPNPSVTSNKRAIFNLNVTRRMSKILDGTSSTVIISEIISGPNGSPDLRGQWWADWGSHYEHLYGPNSNSDAVAGWASFYCNPLKVHCDNSATCWSTVHFAASSYHPGGVNVGLADASVRFVSDDIDHSLWQAMASINGNELIPPN